MSGISTDPKWDSRTPMLLHVRNTYGIPSWKEWVGGPISRVELESWGRLSGLICIACLKVHNPRERQGLLSKKKTARRSSVILMVQNGSWFSYQLIKFKVIDGYWRQKTLVLNGYRMLYFVFLWFFYDQWVQPDEGGISKNLNLMRTKPLP